MEDIMYPLSLLRESMFKFCTIIFLLNAHFSTTYDFYMLFLRCPANIAVNKPIKAQPAHIIAGSFKYFCHRF